MTTKATTAVVNLTNPTITGTVTASSFSGPATQVTLVATNTTNATHYLNFTNAATGNEEIRTDTNLSYNPSTNTLTAGTFSGSGASLTDIVKTINSTSGDVTLSSLTDFAKSHSASGYQKLPGGWIIQWGAPVTLGAQATSAQTFPIAFPTACRSLSIQDLNRTDALLNVGMTAAPTRTGFTMTNGGGGSTKVAWWFAMGY